MFYESHRTFAHFSQTILFLTINNLLLMAKFNTYVDEDNNDYEFTVFIIHGHTPELSKVDKFIRKELNFRTAILQKDYKPGETIDGKLKDRLKQVDCAVAIMSPDDHTTTGMHRSRQNVIYELGYCRRYLKKWQIIVLKEESVEMHSDLQGLIYIGYKQGVIESTFDDLNVGIDEIYSQFGEEDED